MKQDPANPEAEAQASDMWLTSLEHWWKQTGNPLFAWEAIARCLNANPPAPIPGWCLSYVAETARRITDLSWQAARRQISPAHAAKKLGEALGVVRQGTNHFAQVPKDRDAVRYALAAEHEPKTGGTFKTFAGEEAVTEPWAGRTVRRIKKECNLETDHAAKAILRRGRKRIGLDQTS